MTEQRDQPIFREVQQWNAPLRWLIVLSTLVTAVITVVATAATMRDSFEPMTLLLSIACGVLLPSGAGPPGLDSQAGDRGMTGCSFRPVFSIPCTLAAIPSTGIE